MPIKGKNMTSKNKVAIRVKGKDNISVVVGGSVGGASSGVSENELRVSVDGDKHSTVAVAGDVGQDALSEFRDVLISSLLNKNDKDNVFEIVVQLGEQANKPNEERNVSKIKRLLNDLSSYIKLASATVINIEKVKMLYSQIVKFFGF